MKTKLIIFIICLIDIIFSFEQEFNFGDTDENKVNNDKPDPYLVFGVPPWTKYKDIKKRYNKIKKEMKEKNLLNSLKFKRYKNAFENLEQIYKKNNYKDQSFFDVIKTTIKNIFFYESIIFAVLFLSWAVYKYNSFAALLVATFFSVDSIIPHWFSNAIIQGIFSFILTLIIYFRNYYLPGGKNEEENNNENENTNNIMGRRKRRRFEKIE